MAERVQANLEKCLSELEQMERVGLFSLDETKKIIKKRKQLEYLLRRRTKTKEDYLKYIQYEINVLTLVAKRRKRLGIQLKRKEIDHSIATRINKLFKAAITRNQNDERLWLTQIQFCKRMRWHHTISALFTRMLQVHSHKQELWVEAAKWEFEENHAPENARRFLLQALRFHQNSRLLWTEYFRMELMYTDLVRKRREILGSQGVQDSENDSVVQGKLASAVYRRATETIPDPDFALSLIKVCRDFDFTTNHIEEIYQDIQERHPLAEETLNAVARRPLLTLDEELKSAKVQGRMQGKVISEVEEKVSLLYEEAVEKVQSEKMWSFYIQFAISRWESAKTEKKKLKLLDNVLKLMERANSASLLSMEMFVQWGKLSEEKGDEDARCSVTLEASRKWPKMVSLWVHCLTAHIEAEKEGISALLDEAMGNISDKESLPIWKLGMQWLSFSNPSALKEYFEKGLRIRSICVPVKEMYLEAVAVKDGIEATRELYKRLRLLPVSPELFRIMIRVEKAQLKSSIKWLRTYYEDALKEYGSSDEDLWMELIQLELEHPDGDCSKLDLYHWRAMRTLEDSKADSFVRKYTLSHIRQGQD